MDSPPEDRSGSAPVDRALLDRLVDGELAEAERRQLLEQLECTPGAWRQCALAFLEAQCWRESLSTWKSRAAEGVPVGVARPLTAPVRRLGRWQSLAALAASVFVAGVLGWVVGAGGWPSTSVAPIPLAGTPAAVVPPTAPQEDRPSGVQLAQWASISGGSPPVPEQPPETWGEGWQTVAVRVTDPSGLAIREIPLPVIPTQGIDPSWFHPAPLPPEMCECLRRQGYEIRQHRALVPTACGDGRCVVMPVDQVEIHYVGNGRFQ